MKNSRSEIGKQKCILKKTQSRTEEMVHEGSDKCDILKYVTIRFSAPISSKNYTIQKQFFCIRVLLLMCIYFIDNVELFGMVTCRHFQLFFGDHFLGMVTSHHFSYFSQVVFAAFCISWRHPSIFHCFLVTTFQEW